MLATAEGFERLTEDEATGAAVGLVLGFSGGSLYLGIEMGFSFSDEGHINQLNELQPDKTAAAAGPHKFSTGQALEILAAPALLGAVLGALAVSAFRRRSHRQAKQEKIDTVVEEEVDEGLLALQDWANTH